MSWRQAAAAMLLCLVLMLPAGRGALAHVAGTTGYAKVSLHDGTIRYRLTLGIDALVALGSEAALGPGRTLRQEILAEIVARQVAITVDGIPCMAMPAGVTPPSADRANVIVTVDYACRGKPGELTLSDNLSDALGPDHHTLTSIEAPGGAQQFTLERGAREARLSLAPAVVPAAAGIPYRGGLLAFFRLGVEHILEGFDHLLFLLALLLRGGRLGSLLAIVTAFTLAHSITLVLAVLDLAAPPSGLVEPMIALSIVYVAAENILAAHPATRRWAVGFAFGLMHGFGFAGALQATEMPRDALAGALLSFNLGVEAGQALVIACILPLILRLRCSDMGERILMGFSALLLIAGLALMTERILVAAG